MKPFLLLQSRPEDAASDGEHASFLQFSGLENHQLIRERVEDGIMPEINLKDYSGIFMGGGPYNASDPYDKKSQAQRELEKKLNLLMDKVVEYDFPFLGACYGIGVIGTHQGGIISRKFGEEVEPTTITLTPDGLTDPLLKDVPRSFSALVGHKEACEILPTSATLLASSAKCPVQMFRIKQNIYATQFHPELDSPALEARLRVYQHAGYFPPETLEEVIKKGYATPLIEPKKILRNFVERYQVSKSS